MSDFIILVKSPILFRAIFTLQLQGDLFSNSKILKTKKMQYLLNFEWEIGIEYMTVKYEP